MTSKNSVILAKARIDSRFRGNDNGAYADRTIAAYRWRAKEAIANWGRRHRPSAFLRKFVDALGPGARVLDYGCGIGTDMAWMRRNRLQVEGMDGTLEFVNEARRRCPGVGVRYARFEKAEISAWTYDGIWCNAALIHVPPRMFGTQLEKLKVGLKPNGLLGITLAWGRTKGFTRQDWIPGRYLAGYTKSELKSLLRKWTVREIKVVSKDGRGGRWIQILASGRSE